MKAWFEGMVANVPGMIYRALRHSDGTLKFLYVSEGCAKLLGIEPDHLLADALALQRMVHPADMSSYQNSITLANSQCQAWKWQGRFVLPSGTEKVVQGLGEPHRQQSGVVIWDGLLMDVTEQFLAEKKVAELAAIVEGSEDAILSKTLEGIVTSWNPAAEMMYGYTAQEIIGTPITRLLPPDRLQEVNHLLKRIAKGERINRFETVRRARNGSLLDVSLTISPIHDSAGHLIGASTIAHDISEHKRMTGELAATAARDKRIAETLQRTMLQVSPYNKFSHICVESLYQAALDEAFLGGDFFDAFSLGSHKVALVIGDVSGKGLMAAARTAEVKYALRALLHEYEAPEIALAHLNHFICETLRLDSDNRETFIMLGLAVMDTITGETVFASAGPEPTLILRKDGKAEPVEIIGMPLGIEPGEVYTSETRILESGETVIFATDGITEARCGKAFLGTDGLAQLLQSAGTTTSLTVLSKTIYDGALSFSQGDLRDDVCLLLARRQ